MSKQTPKKPKRTTDRKAGRKNRGSKAGPAAIERHKRLKAEKEKREGG